MLIRRLPPLLEGTNDAPPAGGASGGNITPPAPTGATAAAGATGGAPPPVDQPVALGEDGDIPTGKDIRISSTALSQRISRASTSAVSKALKDIFGTDDRASIRKQQETSAQLAKDAEERRLASMNDLQRAQEQARVATERASQAEAREQQMRDELEVGQATQAISDVAAKHINPKFVKLVMTGFADHLGSGYTSEQLEAMGEAEREKLTVDWFTQYAKDNPEVAIKPPTATNPGNPPPPVTRPLQNGVGTPHGAANARPAGRDYKIIEEGPFKGKRVQDLSKVEFARYMKDRHNITT